VELYHWTNARGLAEILREGLIRTTWPRETSDAIPNRVVWLTSRRDPNQGWSLNKDLSAYIRVDVPRLEVVPWSAYAKELLTAIGIPKALRHLPP